MAWLIPPDSIVEASAYSEGGNDILNGNFPESPTINHIHYWYGRYFLWNGAKWENTIRVFVSSGGGGTPGEGDSVIPVSYSFTNANLTAGNYVINHNIGAEPVSFEIINNEDELVLAGYENISLNSLVVYLSPFVPISGTWTINLLFPIT